MEAVIVDYTTKEAVRSYGIDIGTIKHFNGCHANALLSASILQPTELPGETFSHAQIRGPEVPPQPSM
jgi:hypothetical protein